VDVLDLAPIWDDYTRYANIAAPRTRDYFENRSKTRSY